MRFLRCAVVVVVLASCAGAQEASSPPVVPSQAPAEHPGTVILSRSVDDSTPAAAATPAAKTAEAPTDAERQAITFLSYDLDVHLRPTEHAMAVRARVLLRNDSTTPMQRVPLQISSTLEWTSVRIADAPAAFSQQLVDSDIDHTGALREAVIHLPQPLAPQQTIAVDLTYEGTAALSSTRLEQIGTPTEVAESSDWDRVADDFVGLRGFGNVAWCLIASVPVALGDGAKFFSEAAEERQRQSQATVTMKATSLSVRERQD